MNDPALPGPRGRCHGSYRHAKKASGAGPNQDVETHAHTQDFCARARALERRKAKGNNAIKVMGGICGFLEQRSRRKHIERRRVERQPFLFVWLFFVFVFRGVQHAVHPGQDFSFQPVIKVTKIEPFDPEPPFVFRAP